MIVNMAANATEEQIQHVMERIKECGFLPHLIQGAERTVIGVVGKNRGRRAVTYPRTPSRKGRGGGRRFAPSVCCDRFLRRTWSYA